MSDLRWDWNDVQAARKAVHDAPDLLARLHALFHYQGLLLQFVDKHWSRIDQWADRQP